MIRDSLKRTLPLAGPGSLANKRAKKLEPPPTRLTPTHHCTNIGMCVRK